MIPGLTSALEGSTASSSGTGPQGLYTGAKGGVTTGGINFGPRLEPATIALVGAIVVVGLLVLKK